MVSEEELAKLPYPGAPKIVTKIPGPKSQKVLEVVPKFESLTRPGGAAPPVFDEGMGATVKDPDGNIFIDLSAGAGRSGKMWSIEHSDIVLNVCRKYQT